MDGSTKTLPNNEKIGVILSPSFYWIRRELLPAKNAKQAKELAPSVFDTVIPHGDYSFMAVESQEQEQNESGEKEFFLFAYDTKAILASLEEKGASRGDIEAVWFAQTELLFEGALKIDENVTLVKNDKIVNRLPTQLIESEQSIQELSITHSKHTVELELYNGGWLDKTSFHALSIALIVLGITFLAELWLVKKDFANAEEKKEQMLQKYNLPQSSMQIKAILAETRDREFAQLKIRDNLLYVSNLQLLNGEQFQKIELIKNSIHIAVKLSKADRAEEVKAFFKKRFTVANPSMNGQILTVELK